MKLLIISCFKYKISLSKHTTSIHDVTSMECNAQDQEKNTKIQQLQPTFQSEDPRIRIHKSRICSNRPPQRLHRHVHINDNHAVLRSRFSNAYILIRLHRHVREIDELRIDADARQLQITKPDHTKSHHSCHY